MVLVAEDKRAQFFLRLLQVFVFAIPISPFLSVRIIFILLLFFLFLKDKESYTVFLFKFWDIGIYIVVSIVGLIYTQDIVTGLKVQETNFSLLAIPIVCFGVQAWNEEKIVKIFYVFTCGLLVACIICLSIATAHYARTGSTQFFFYDHFTSPINSHPTYFAYYIILAITFGLYLLYYERTQVKVIYIVTIILFLFVMLILTGGVTAFISILFVFSFFILKFIVEEKQFKRQITLGLICIMMVSMFITSAISLDDRNFVLTDSWERFILWQSAFKATPSLIWGVGTGDYKVVLNEYFVSHDLNNFAKDSYNSHNQFIQTLFTNGILGILSLLLVMGRPLYLSVKHKDVLGTLIFFPFLIYGMTEVFLGRYQGVVFFVLLHQIFINSYANSKIDHVRPHKNSY
jgi:O-antigen ligase